MKVYLVVNREENYNEEFYNLTSAKKAMKEHNAKGYIYKIYSNGDMVSCGEIAIKSNNKTFVANSKQIIKSY
jgi:hypothetical protein